MVFRSRAALSLAALAFGVAGCNELSFIPDQTVPAGTTIAMPITLSLDPGIVAGGLQSTLTVDPPLILGDCVFAAGIADPVSDMVALDARSARLLTLAAEAHVGWIGSLTIYTCQVTIPPDTAFGAYALRFHAAGLSDISGHELPLVSSHPGVIHVI